MPRHARFSATTRRVAAALGALSFAGGCAGGPQTSTGPQSNPSGARGLLAAASAQGPVPLVIDNIPVSFPGGASQIAGTASNSVSWLGASFTPSTTATVDQRRVVFRFSDQIRDPASTCAGKPVAGPPPTPPLQLFAVFCDGTRPVADASGTASSDGTTASDQLVAAVTDRLFPGNSTTGYSNSIPGVSVGVGVGSWGNSGWGLGGGLFF
jgi:hypothetical protein